MLKPFVLATIAVLMTTLCLAQEIVFLPNVQKPRLETKTSVFDYLLSMHIDTANCYFINEDKVDRTLDQTLGMPVLMIFDKEGNQLEYTTTKKGCVNPAFQLSTLDSRHKYKLDTLNTLPGYMGNYTSYNAQPAHVDQEVDFTALNFWVKFLGTYDNNEKVRDWEQILKKNKSIKVRIVKVNMDAQQSWSPKYQDAHLAVLTAIYKAVKPFETIKID